MQVDADGCSMDAGWMQNRKHENIKPVQPKGTGVHP